MAADKDIASFSEVCTKRCGGLCCNPWWGIISYGVVKKGGLSGLRDFKGELASGIREREKRITSAYVTTEDSPRPLFGTPERYSVKLTGVKRNGASLELSLLAMFAFRCRFLSENNICSIHPSLMDSKEIRPPHCGNLGSPLAKSGEKWYCRVIEAAGSGDEALMKAIEVEKASSARHLKEGFATADEAAENVIEGLRAFCIKSFPDLLPQEKAGTPGRNDPCWCGSGEKFKRCHGR